MLARSVASVSKTGTNVGSKLISGICQYSLKTTKTESETETHREKLILENTKVDITWGGIKLNLITKDCPLWYCHDEYLLPFKDPWWAFVFPGGMGLTRYICENPEIVQGKSVLDIGSGSGSASVAAAVHKARSVLANDIDPFAGTALRMNLRLNFDMNSNLKSTKTVSFSSENNIVSADSDFFSQFDVVLAGDMLYDETFSPHLLKALQDHRCVLFGDPGRLYSPKELRKEQLLAEYDFQEDGFESIKVFKL